MSEITSATSVVGIEPFLFNETHHKIFFNRPFHELTGLRLSILVISAALSCSSFTITERVSSLLSMYYENPNVDKKL